MPVIKKVSLALTSDLLAMIRQAVETGDYASNSEVVRDALRLWKTRRVGADLMDGQNAAVAAKPSVTSAELAANPVGRVFQIHHKALGELCQRFAVRRLALFGAALRGDFNPVRSDVDLAVEFADPIATSPARQYFDFKAALEQLLARRVDLIELAAMPDSRLRRIIERTQITVYAKAG